MIAHNQYHEGDKSEVKTIQYDKDLEVIPVENLIVVGSSNNTVTLKWNYPKRVDHFVVSVAAERPYPDIPDRITFQNGIVVSDLAPGVTYTFSVSTTAIRRLGWHELPYED